MAPAGAPGGLRPLAMAAAVVLATVVGEAMHVADPSVDRRLLGAVGAGLDVAAVVARRRAWSATLLRRGWRSLVGPLAVVVGVATGAGAGDRRVPSERAASCCRPCRRSRCRRSRSSTSSGEAVLLALALGPLVAGGLLVWTLLGASLDERRRMRWLALSLRHRRWESWP